MVVSLVRDLVHDARKYGQIIECFHFVVPVKSAASLSYDRNRLRRGIGLYPDWSHIASSPSLSQIRLKGSHVPLASLYNNSPIFFRTPYHSLNGPLVAPSSS